MTSSVSNTTLPPNWQNLPGHFEQMPGEGGVENLQSADMPHALGSGSASAPSVPGQNQSQWTPSSNANNANGSLGANGQGPANQNAATNTNGSNNGFPNGNGVNDGVGQIGSGSNNGNSPFGVVDGLTSTVGNTLSNMGLGDPLGIAGNMLSGAILSAPLSMADTFIDNASSLLGNDTLGSALYSATSNSSTSSVISNSSSSTLSTSARSENTSAQDANEFQSVTSQNFASAPENIARPASEYVTAAMPEETVAPPPVTTNPLTSVSSTNAAYLVSTGAQRGPVEAVRGLATSFGNSVPTQRTPNAEENAVAASQSNIVRLPGALTLLASPAIALDEESTANSTAQTALFRGQTADGRQSIQDILGNNFVFTGESRQTTRNPASENAVRAIGTAAVNPDHTSSPPSSLSSEEIIWKQVVPALGGITALLSGALAGSTTVLSPGGAAAPTLLTASAAIFGFGAFRGYQALKQSSADGANPYSLRDSGVRQAWLALGVQGAGLLGALALLV